MPLIVILLALILPAAQPLEARTLAATLLGTVIDQSGAAVEGAEVRLFNRVSAFEREVSTNVAGRFRIANVPLHGYELEVSHPGFRTFLRPIEMRSSRPEEVEVRLEVALRHESFEVSTTASATLLSPRASGTKVQLGRRIIEKLPVASSLRGLEALLLGFPGFAANANGSIHPRGAHNQMTYVVDGMPISDQFSGQFSTSIDPSLVETLELFTGNIPPEYGAKVSGVARVTTRSGFDGGGRPFGQMDVGAGGFDTVTGGAQIGGTRGDLGWFASLSSVKTNRFLDSPSFDNLHNGGNAQRVSARLDWHRSLTNVFRASVMAGRSSFQLANLRSQHASGQRQRRELDDQAFSLGYVRVLSPAATLESTTSLRTTSARLEPSPGDTPVTAQLDRALATLASFNRVQWQRGRHEAAFGFDAQHFPLSESFSFGLTDPGVNRPGSPQFNPNLLAHDLTRGGSPFRFRDAASGQLLSGFVRDRLTLGPLVLDLGLRLDRYSMLVLATELQPRVGFAYHLRPTGTVLRASYNRNLQTPPNENLLLANAPESAALAPPEVRRGLGGGAIPIQPQRQNAFEVGLQQALGGRLSLDAAYYHKHSSNAQDNDNFLNTGIIFPTSLAFSRVNGFEARVVLPTSRRVTGSLGVTHFRAIVTPPFTGGLFLASSALDALSDGPFVIDHDQVLGASGNILVRLARTLWASSQVRFDSGLVANPSDPEQVAADPDYYDQLPFVNLLSDPPRIRPRVVVDASLGYEHFRGDRRAWELAFQITNLTNRRALYSFQSVFVGTRVVQPATASLRLRVFW
ncbi:MAG: TonB-dependent receptor [Bryobacterales bacterium]|nr:TonB-dependent receptor [Bryobacterales bacterium]